MNKQQIPLRAAGYLRVSTDEQKEKYGIPLQKAAIEGVIASKGKLDNGKPAMVLAGKQYLYSDEGISGTTQVEKRPAFIQMKEDIENAPGGVKPFDIVIVYRIDRFARKLRILLDVIEYFDSKNIQFISANESIDTSSPFGKAMLGIIGVIAELERETTIQRTRDGRKQAVNSGSFMGASPPFGYIKNKEKRLKVFEEEAKTVREIFELFVVEKKNTQQIADYLNNKKVLTPLASALKHEKRKHGRTKANNPYFWRDVTVLGIIKDEVYLGRYYFGKTKDGIRLEKSQWQLSPIQHVSIVGHGKFALAQIRIQEEIASRNSKKTADNHLYLLSGLLKCHACYDPYSDRDPLNWSGTSKVLKKSGNRAYYYHCGAKNVKKHPIVCKAIPFPADEIEQFVTDFIKNLLNDPQSVYIHINSLQSTKSGRQRLEQHQQDITDRLNDLPRHREALKHLHENGHMGASEFDDKITLAAKNEDKLKKDLLVIQNQIGEKDVSDIYNRTFKLFAKQYKSFLAGAMSDRQELSDLIHLIVDRIHVYTRKATKKDVIAGRKTQDQVIPNQIRIDLRLPQDIMHRFAEQGKFEVRNDDL